MFPAIVLVQGFYLDGAEVISRSGLRFLVRLRNSHGFKPADCKGAAGRARAALERHPVRVENFRVSNSAVEFDLFANVRFEAEEAADRLSKEFGDLLTFKSVDQEPLSIPDVEAAMSTAKELFNEERFWEFHEFLEQFWRRAEGREKEVLQGLILVAAALVHFQKDEPEVCLGLLRKGREKMVGVQSYHGIPLNRVVEAVDGILRTGRIEPFRV